MKKKGNVPDDDLSSTHKMARNKQLARKFTGGYAPEYNEKVKQARLAINYTWLYVMVRFIDVRNRIKMDINGHLDAATIIDLCKPPNDIYKVFGLENETDARLHAIAGIQARRYEDDRLDAYILVGFRVRQGQDIEIVANDTMVQNINNHFIFEGATSCLEPEHITIIYDDNYEAVELCTNIIIDMEDRKNIGFISDVAY